jgi:hypothetical protein
MARRAPLSRALPLKQIICLVSAGNFISSKNEHFRPYRRHWGDPIDRLQWVDSRPSSMSAMRKSGDFSRRQIQNGIDRRILHALITAHVHDELAYPFPCFPVILPQCSMPGRSVLERAQPRSGIAGNAGLPAVPCGISGPAYLNSSALMFSNSWRLQPGLHSAASRRFSLRSSRPGSK